MLTCEEQQIVFHLAASFGRTEIEQGFFNENFYNNVELTHTLLSCNHHWEKFIFASSYLVYDPLLYLWDDTHFLKESDRIAPRNIVGAAKYYTENELDFVCQGEKMQGVSARIFRVYGRGSKDIISRTIQKALRGEPIIIYGERARFDYIFADDVAEGLIRLAEVDFPTTAVNLGTGKGKSLADVLEIVQSYTSTKVEYTKMPGHPIENSRADVSLLKELTKWTPPTTLEVGVRKVLEYERELLESSS
jgi:nucleoside-diphosphate-sugar epimerase